MPASIIKSPSCIGTPKPVNIFYIWYTELCRRLNTTPLNIVKPAKPKNETVLDFVTDRIKPEEWTPIVNALRLDTSLHVLAIRAKVQCKFMDDITTEEKVKSMKRRAGSVWTPYILKKLIYSVGTCIRRSSVLTFLELDGLPVSNEYLEELVEALRKSTTIKVLSLQHCPIRDVGCEKLCQALRHMPNIEVVNLTACLLGSMSAQYIGKVIRFQQINRYCESWHSSLRYEDPEVGVMAGLKRITLNNNPNIGDEGLQFILNELDDDLWIKAIDMQKCNITNNMATRLVDVIDYSRSLEVADFRNNDQLSHSTVQKILEILKSKQRYGFESEFQWCVTATTLPYQQSISEIASNINTNTNDSRIIQKSRSTPFRTTESKKSTHSLGLRRMQTTINIPLRNNMDKYNNYRVPNMADAKKEVLQLNAQLQREIAKRVKTEEENRKLLHEITSIKSSALLLHNSNSFTKQGNNNNNTDTRKVSACKSELKEHCTRLAIKEMKNDLNSINKECHKKSVEFVFSAMDNKNRTSAQNLFENILAKSGSAADDSSVEEEYEEYFKNTGMDDVVDTSETECTETDSNASLIKFMEEVKKRDSTLSKKCTDNRTSTNWNAKQQGTYQRIITPVR